MSKYLEDKLFAICYKFVRDKYKTIELSPEQMKECNDIEKSYIHKAGDFINENGKTLKGDLTDKKVFLHTLYQIAIKLLAEDIQANRV